MSDYRTGFVSILGLPNAGKSTLVNALIGEKIAAVSGLPQTTRDRINAILSGEDFQIVLVDLPGLVDATDKLNEALRQNVVDGLEGVDCVVHLVDVTMADPVGEDARDVLNVLTTPVIFVASKVDAAPAGFSVEAFARNHDIDLSRYAGVRAVSSIEARGLSELVETIRDFMPEGPPLYDPDDLTDRDLRFLAAEIIREKVFHFTHQEVPYSTAVEIDDFKERKRGKWYVAASIHIERDSQKGVVIGKGGAMLKRISQAARADIEKLCDTPVFLELHVKVTKNWRKNDARLREFGYKRK